MAKDEKPTRTGRKVYKATAINEGYGVHMSYKVRKLSGLTKTKHKAKLKRKKAQNQEIKQE